MDSEEQSEKLEGIRGLVKKICTVSPNKQKGKTIRRITKTIKSENNFSKLKCGMVINQWWNVRKENRLQPSPLTNTGIMT